MIGVHVSNQNAGLLTNTNLNGTFKIPVQPGDSLLLTFVGYEPLTFVVPEGQETELLSFQMMQTVTQLAEVEVNVFPEYWRFKQMIVDSQPEDTEHVVFGLDAIPLNAYALEANEQKIVPENYQAPTLAIGFNLGGLTKEGKEKRKLEKILAKQEIERKAYLKFNREWIAKETKLNGDELTDFIAYCKFKPEYLANSTLFEIRERMMALLEDFKAEQGVSDNRSYHPGA